MAEVVMAAEGAIAIESAIAGAAVGEGVMVAETAATGLFGFGTAATIGIAIIAVVAIGGITYLIIKKCQKGSQDTLPSQPQPKIKKKQFKAPQLPKHDQISSFSEALTISAKQVDDIQKAYSCQIGYTLMVEPVLGLCCKKRNYQKVVIEAWIDQKGKCPFCNKNITKDDLVPNQALKNGIKIFRKQLAKRVQKMAQKRIQQDGLN